MHLVELGWFTWLCRRLDEDGVFGLLEVVLGIASHLFHVERFGDVGLGDLVLAQAALEEVRHCA
jgi:hypothetical protein